MDIVSLRRLARANEPIRFFEIPISVSLHMLMDNVHLPGLDNLLSETMASVNSPFAVVTEEEILQIITFLEWFMLSSSLCTLIQSFSSISVNSGF